MEWMLDSNTIECEEYIYGKMEKIISPWIGTDHHIPYFPPFLANMEVSNLSAGRKEQYGI